MKPVSTLSVVIFLMLPLTVSASGEHERSAEYKRCIDKSGGSDGGIQACISAEHDRQDKRLNAAYRKLLGLLKPERKKQLQEAQRLWVKYTEANCDFHYDPDGGTSARLSAMECAVSARVSRAKEMEELIHYQAVSP